MQSGGKTAALFNCFYEVNITNLSDVRLMSYFLLLSDDLVAINDGLDDFKVVGERSEVRHFARCDATQVLINANRASRTSEGRHTQHFVERNVGVILDLP